MFHRFEEIFRKFYINHKNGPFSRNEKKKKIKLSTLNFFTEKWFLMSSVLVEKVSLEKRVDLSNVP